MTATLNLVDSSGWIEYFTESPNAAFFAPAIEDTGQLLVASLSVLEVFKWVLREKGENAALQAGGRIRLFHKQRNASLYRYLGLVSFQCMHHTGLTYFFSIDNAEALLP